MRLFVCLFALVACVGATDPSATLSNCYVPGDTIGVAPLVRVTDSITVSCIWILETRTRCYKDPVERIHADACVEGQKWHHKEP